jgi:GntR family transcriptional regulator
MQLSADGMKPIYVQISEFLETEILSGSILHDEKMYSQYQLAEMFNINPATAAKGLNILADEGILYKKRGLGMFVSPHAKEKISKRRTNQLLKPLISELVLEADRLGIHEDDLISMMKEVKGEMTRRELS